MVLTWGADVPGVETMRKRRTLGTKQKSVLADTAEGSSVADVKQSYKAGSSQIQHLKAIRNNETKEVLKFNIIFLVSLLW